MIRRARRILSRVGVAWPSRLRRAPAMAQARRRSAAPTGDAAQSRAPLAAPHRMSPPRRRRVVPTRLVAAFRRLAVHARRSVGEGGDDRSAAGARSGPGRSSSTNGWCCRRLRRRADKFEKTVLVGPVARRTLSAILQNARSSHGGRVRCRPCANGAAPSKAARRAKACSPGIKDRIDKAMSVTILRETDGIERQIGISRDRRLDRAVHRPVRHGVGHHEFVLGHRRAPRHDACRRRARHRRSPVRHRHGAFRRHSGGRSSTTASSTRSARYANRLDAFADEFSAILSRQLDEKAH